MANRDQHIPVASLAGGGAALLLELVEAKREGRVITGTDLLRAICLGASVGAVFGVLPDIFEPPSHPGHRGLFHSKLTLIGVSALGAKLVSAATLTDPAKSFVIGSVVGYVSHLLLDSQTASGLP